MKQPYKVQNRTSESRRVKFIKNGGLIQFTKDPTASYVENSREGGFCLNPISPLPAQENPTGTITLTAHPMGVNGRVSLFINDVLIESKRYSELSRIVNRQYWFNQEFGAYVEYSGKEFPTFTVISDGVDTYRFDFEDDDLDYQFGDFKLAESSTNPTMFVEQYRLAFDLLNDQLIIDCTAALNRSGIIEVSGEGSAVLKLEDGTLLQINNVDEVITQLRASGFTVDELLDPPKPEISCDGALSQTELYLNGLWDVEIDGEVLGSDLTKDEVFRLINPFQNNL